LRANVSWKRIVAGGSGTLVGKTELIEKTTHLNDVAFDTQLLVQISVEQLAKPRKEAGFQALPKNAIKWHSRAAPSSLPRQTPIEAGESLESSRIFALSVHALPWQAITQKRCK
jgi:hypothetical protein